MLIRIPLLCLVLLFCGTTALGQDFNVDVCRVSLLKPSPKQRAEQGFVLEKLLGTFNPVVGEEERTNRFFRIPGSNLFAVASVFFTDESIQVTDHNDSISLQIAVSRKAKFDPVNSLQNSEAEAIYTKPYAVRVYTLMRVKGLPKLLMLECRRDEKK